MSFEEDQVQLLKIENLSVRYTVGKGLFRRTQVNAVDGVSLNINRGESFGLVGQSGSGKTTMARSIVKLVHPTRGSIYFRGQDIFEHNRKQSKEYRRHVQIIFQDPYESLNPRAKVQRIIEEPLIIHKIGINGEEREQRVEKLLEMVELEPATVLKKYPHELSGGQRQRVAIARALSVGPDLLLADEPVTMLDVSLRAGILNLMSGLKKSLGLTYLFITHDFAAARYFCDRIGVMYRGQIVEVAEADKLINEPVHPYTKLLLDSVPGARQSEELESQTSSSAQKEINGPPSYQHASFS